MEVKVLCSCGVKFQFSVEPVNGLMPQSVACPGCNEDNTDRANHVIQYRLAEAERAAMAPPPPPAPATDSREFTMAPPSPPPPKPLPKPTQTAPPPPAASSQPTAKATTNPPISHETKPASMQRPGVGLATAGVVVVLLGFGGWALYTKWSGRLGKLENLVTAIANNPSESATPATRWTLPTDSAAQLLVKFPNHTNVAEALMLAHFKLCKQRLNISSTSDSYDEHAAYFINPVYKGAVEVSSTWDWSAPKDESAAATCATELSKQLHTTVVMALMGDDGESGVYAVFDNGERKFRLKRWYQITQLSNDGIQEFMEREGEDWARQHGYVPDPAKVLSGDSEAVPFGDANQLTLNLGLDTSDRQEAGGEALVLKPAGSL